LVNAIKGSALIKKAKYGFFAVDRWTYVETLTPTSFSSLPDAQNGHLVVSLSLLMFIPARILIREIIGRYIFFSGAGIFPEPPVDTHPHTAFSVQGAPRVMSLAPSVNDWVRTSVDESYNRLLLSHINGYLVRFPQALHP